MHLVQSTRAIASTPPCQTVKVGTGGHIEWQLVLLGDNKDHLCLSHHLRMLSDKCVENGLMNKLISLNERALDFQSAHRFASELTRTVDLTDRPKHQAKVSDDGLSGRSSVNALKIVPLLWA